MDYGHGTGHGVGYYLNVHEGPNGISKYRYAPMVPGNIVSNGIFSLEFIFRTWVLRGGKVWH